MSEPRLGTHVMIFNPCDNVVRQVIPFFYAPKTLSVVWYALISDLIDCKTLCILELKKYTHIVPIFQMKRLRLK